MRTKDFLYNSLLKIQAELSYPIETSLLRKTNWKQAKNILDYGCGNAYFSKLLARDYPDKTYYCCDRNEKILAFAEQRPNVHVCCGEYPEIKFEPDFDFFLVRHLTSYLNDRKAFFSWINDISTENAGILLIDAFDENLVIEPLMPNFQVGLDKFYKQVGESGGNRNLLGSIIDELDELDFVHQDTLKIVVNSQMPNQKEKLFVYMNLVAELDNGLPLSEDIREELMTWVTDETSYLQYGLFASVFEKK